MGLAPMGIPVSEIVAWLDLHQLMGESRMMIYEVVSLLDVVWLDKAAEKADGDRNRNTKTRR